MVVVRQKHVDDRIRFAKKLLKALILIIDNLVFLDVEHNDFASLAE